MDTFGDAPLPLTGERTVPGVPEENYWFRRHEAAYEFIRELVRGRALEVGCGEGYGTALLARSARVVGIDYDAATVAHARRAYPGVPFVRGNLAALPIRSGSIDVLVSLQVVEHVWDHVQFLGECHRVLRRDGTLVLTTPNRLTFSPGRDTPTNLFHTREFTAVELAALVSGSSFAVSSQSGVVAAERLRAIDQRHGGSFVDAQLATSLGEWSGQLRADVASVTTADFALRSGGGHDCLDLVLVARATG